MDRIALQILEDELRKDGEVLGLAATKARTMLEEELAVQFPMVCKQFIGGIAAELEG